MAEKKTTFNRILYPKRMYCKDDFVRPDIFNGVTELGEAPEAIRTVRLLFFLFVLPCVLTAIKTPISEYVKKKFLQLLSAEIVDFVAGKTSADYVYFCVAVLEDFGESKRRSSSVEARVDQNLRSRLLKDMLPRYLKRCGVETLCKDIWKSNLWVSLFFF